ncbi:hypothetical protein PVAP13_5NG361743, partial [Panicum virgatum]
GADLAFLPGPSAREEAYLRRVGYDRDCGFAVVHSAGGLLLCSRGRVRPRHLYVCNPVTCQWVALPELPLPLCDWSCGHLTLATHGDGGAAARAFKVVLVNHPDHWHGPRGQLDLGFFDSDTGRWEARRVPATYVISDDLRSCLPPPMLGPSGTSYWAWCANNFTVAYKSAGAGGTLDVIKLPTYPDGDGMNQCIGERHGGGLRYMDSNRSVFQVWDAPARKAINRRPWTLVHRVGTTELVARNPGAAALLRNKYTSTWSDRHIKPAGVHPTDDAVVFLALPGAVVAYSIEDGTMSLAANARNPIVVHACHRPSVGAPLPFEIRTLPLIGAISVLA